MSWIDQLSEAVEMVARNGPVALLERPVHDAMRQVLAAARLVLEGEDIWWCEAHGASKVESLGGCGYDVAAICRLVQRRMIDIPEDEK